MSMYKLKRRQDESEEDYALRVENRRQRNIERQREYRKNHKEKYRELSRKYRLKNIEKARAKAREYEHRNYAKRKAKNDLWVARNKKYVAERAKKYRYDHYEHRRKMEIAYYEKTKEKRHDWWVEYNIKNRERLSKNFKKWSNNLIDNARKELLDKIHDGNDTAKNSTVIYGVVYMISNVCTDRFYIGQAKCIKTRYRSGIRSFVDEASRRSHSKVLEDYHMFGEDSFLGPDIIAVAASKEELDLLEAHYIKVYDSFNTGYNQTRGNVRSVHRKAVKEANT